MKNQEERKDCFNCRYLSRHYAKTNQSYTETFCGNCLNPELSHKEKRTNRFYGCPLWEPLEIQLNERRKNIEEALITMSARLEVLTQILLSDEELRQKRSSQRYD